MSPITKILLVLITSILLIPTSKGQDCDSLEQVIWEFEIVGNELAIGNEFYIECYVRNFTEVLAFQYSIGYDPNIIKLNAIDNTGSPLIGVVEGNLTSGQVNTGNVPIIWTNGNGEGQTLPDSSAIFKLFFEVIGGDPGECSFLEINSNAIDIEIAIELPDGNVCRDLRDINFLVTGSPLCLSCTEEIFISTNFCHGDLSFAVCGGQAPYSYQLISSNIQLSGNIAEEETVSFTNLENQSYSLIITDSNNESQTKILEFSPLEEPIIEGSDFCSGESSTLTTSAEYSTYLWLNIDNEIIEPNDPLTPWQITVFESGLYTVFVSNADCEAKAEIVIEEIAPLGASVSDAIICNSSASGSSTILDLNSLVINPTGEFVIQDLAGNLLNTAVIDFEGSQTGFQAFTVFFDGNGICPDETYFITIQVIACDCPEVLLFPIGDFCNDSEVFINLFDFLTADTGPGNFTVLNSDGSIATVQADTDGLLLIDQNFTEGNYSLVYTLDNTQPDCPESSIQSFSIFKKPEIQTFAPPPVCNSDTLGNTTFIGLNSYVAGATGIWTDANGNEIINTTLDFNGSAPGFYNFVFTSIDAEGPCFNTSVSIEVEVLECSISSINEIDDQILNIFPNPSSGSINLELTENMQVQIFDVSGRNILKINLASGSNLLQLEGQEKGVYLMKFYNKGKFYGVHKLLIH